MLLLRLFGVGRPVELNHCLYLILLTLPSYLFLMTGDWITVSPVLRP